MSDSLHTTAHLQPRPAPADPGPWRFPDVERTTLANGLSVATCHLPGQAVVELRLTIRGGGRSDPSGYEGLTMLAARCLTEGPAGLDGDDFTDALETLGARIGTDLHWDASIVSASASRTRVADLLRLVADVVTRPAFRDDDLARLLRQGRDAATRGRQFPQQRASETFARAAFARGSRRALPIAGSVESLAAIETSMAARHWRAAARPDQATLHVVGDLTDLDPVALAEAAFGSWTPIGDPLPPAPPVEANGAAALEVVDIAGAPQAQLFVGMASESVDTERRPALRLAVHALGGHFNSLLMNELREHRGVTYGVNAGVDHTGGASTLAIGGAFQSEAAADSVLEIVRQLRELAALPPDDAIATAAENLVRTGPTSFRSAAAVAGALVRNTVEGLPDDHDDRVRAAVAATTPAEAAAALDGFLSDSLVIAAVGDAESLAGKVSAALGVEATVDAL